MIEKSKETYLPPVITVFELKLESSVLTGSGTPDLLIPEDI